MATMTQHHTEWLSLLEISGSFLSMPVLQKYFQYGLPQPTDEQETRRLLRRAYEEWRDSQLGVQSDPGLHRAWVRFVLTQVLGLGSYLQEGQQIPASLSYEAREYGETLRPEYVIGEEGQSPRLLVQIYAPTQDLRSVVRDRLWKASPETRMMELLRSHALRLGLVTNGEQWMLVDYPGVDGETTGYYSWEAPLWLEEPLALRAFRTLLSEDRFFGVPDGETLEALLRESSQNQQDVTTQLGDQVRHAVEMLVQTLDQMDKNSQRVLLRDVNESVLYEAALTVMMRLVFLLFAEENHLLPCDEELYDANYAASTLLAHLQKQADDQGESVLSHRSDAWSRLLALFRAVYGGIEYPDLRLPAYGGHLFDPDRYPFLEGRPAGSRWLEVPAQPLLIDNLTVLHMLRALQFLNAGNRSEARRLSFRALDIEQIGHVYEGLLDHTARRAPTTILELQGTKDASPILALEELEKQAAQGEAALIAYLREATKLSENRLKKDLGKATDHHQRQKLMQACDNDPALFDRVLPYLSLVKRNTFGSYTVITPSSVYVTTGSDRRSTGTHYTPRSLTEPMVQHALDPLVYHGPAEGLPPEEWKLHSAGEILDLKICDMAMGSGAFLVETCRYLSMKLVAAWEIAEKQLSEESPGRKIQITPEGLLSHGEYNEELLPNDPDERLAVARRIISERCLYGVDKNPMAVEMAKLSLWLITLAKNKPFTFLDHALRCGDSLLGVNLSQLRNWTMHPEPGKVSQMHYIGDLMDRSVAYALKLRQEILALHDNHVDDVNLKERKLREAEEAMAVVRLGADLLTAIALAGPKRGQNLQDLYGTDYSVLLASYEEALLKPTSEQGKVASRTSFAEMRGDVDELLGERKPFHWPLEFPEIFTSGNEGFAAIIGNPPFMGGSNITGVLGTDYRDYMVEHIAQGRRGNADLCAYFFLRASKVTQNNGLNALLATNTVAQGDTREVGLDQIISSGWSILRAISSRKWLGKANLEVAFVWLRNGNWHNLYILNDRPVIGITPRLSKVGAASGNPHHLFANSNKAFNGSKMSGMGFVLPIEKALSLMEKDSCNKSILFPFLNGEDINSRPDQSPSRWAINFFDWPLEKAETYRDCMKIVREKVKPERDHNNMKVRREKWWQYGTRAEELYSTVRNLSQVLVISRVSKYTTCAWEPEGIVYSEAICVIASDRISYFVLLQNTFHAAWVRLYGSSMKNDPRYTPSDCFETFPFPVNMEILEDIGERYYSYRQSITLGRHEGLTQTYNRFHDPEEGAGDIVRLRELHQEMDELVAKAYGWDDLRLDHDFHQTKQGLRFTISEAAREEVLDRLLALNHQRHQEEVEAGLWDEKGKKTGKAKNGKASNGVVDAEDIAKKKLLKQAANPVEPVVGMEQGTLF